MLRGTTRLKGATDAAALFTHPETLAAAHTLLSRLLDDADPSAAQTLLHSLQTMLAERDVALSTGILACLSLLRLFVEQAPQRQVMQVALMLALVSIDNDVAGHA